VGCTYLTVCVNFVFYGLSYALPQVFQKLSPEMGPAKQLFISSCGSVPGVLFTGLLLMCKITNRDRLILAAALVAGLELCVTLSQEDHAYNYVGLEAVAALGLKAFSYSFFNLVYVYLGCVFPSECRCSAVAFCVAGGRIGSIFSPILFEATFARYQKSSTYFALCALSCIVAMLVIRFFLKDEVWNEAGPDVAAAESTLNVAAAAAASAATNRERRLSQLSSEDVSGSRRSSDTAISGTTGGSPPLSRKRRTAQDSDKKANSHPSQPARSS